MSKLDPLLVVAFIFLIPLIPAAALYWGLSSKRNRDRGRARGEIGGGDVRILGMTLKFDVVGSTATYIVLLLAFFAAHSHVSDKAALQEAMQDKNAWLVEAAVYLKGNSDQMQLASNGEMKTLSIDFEPSTMLASATDVRFWVVPKDGRFPTATFTLRDIGKGAAVLDLNDPNQVEADPNGRKIIAVKPIYLELSNTRYSGAGEAPVSPNTSVELPIPNEYASRPPPQNYDAPRAAPRRGSL